MPYVLSPIIKVGSSAMWLEGAAYEKKNIYSIVEGKLPPVNYDEHLLRPHSLTHVETNKHTQKDGDGIDVKYQENLSYFYGSAIVIRLRGNNYKLVDESKNIYHWEVAVTEITDSLKRIQNIKLNDIEKILLTTDNYFENQEGFHDPNYVLTLSQEASDFLVGLPKFNLYGTSWKSSDYKPGSSERPIHNTIFKKALIVECLKLKDVPEGTYFLTCFPLPLEGASETPVVPVLFEKNELQKFI
jgi:arylformamidase